ncbi:hypothetical protein M9458_042092, partial [Cirrhinus mrigala]
VRESWLQRLQQRAMDSEITERSSAHCTMVEGELTRDQGMLDFKEEFTDLYADL